MGTDSSARRPRANGRRRTDAAPAAARPGSPRRASPPAVPVWLRASPLPVSGKKKKKTKLFLDSTDVLRRSEKGHVGDICRRLTVVRLDAGNLNKIVFVGKKPPRGQSQTVGAGHLCSGGCRLPHWFSQEQRSRARFQAS